MFAVVLFHAALALAMPWLSRRLGRRTLLVAGLGPLAGVAWLVLRAGELFDRGPVVETLRWVPDLGLEVAFRADAFSWLMGMLVAGVGVLVFVYASAYLKADGRLGRFAAALVAFAGAMLGLVLADNLFLLYVFWELTSVTSYLLIGYDDQDEGARRAARQALLVTAGGGLAMLAGFVVLGQAAGTYRLSELVTAVPEGGAGVAGLALVLAGIATKSAQIPFHAWLPGAMAAPTPVSAYLHSATMVKAGVYLAARLAPGFAEAHGFWTPTLLALGGATMVFGGLRALRQTDLKLLLAHGTVSQLGFLMLLLGSGIPELTHAGVAVLLAHAVFKGCLFLVVGAVDHEAHTRDIRELSGMARRVPYTFGAAVLAVASMVGLPPLFGFVAKEAAFEELLHVEGAAIAAALVLAAVGSVLTVAYSARFLWGGFSGSTDQRRHERPYQPLVFPSLVLAAASAALGLLAGLTGGLVEDAATVLTGEAPGAELVLWHGPTPALALSAGVVAMGLLLFAARDPVERLRGLRLPDATALFERAVVAVGRVADRVTGTVQNGSLPFYLTVILAVAVIVPAVALGRGDAGPSFGELGSPLQVAVCGLVVGAAAGAVFIRRRFAAALTLGAVGYGVAVLFVIQGAPDLALTQLVVETVTLAAFVFVLRRLPETFGGPGRTFDRVTRAAVAVTVGAFVTVFALVAVNARVAEPVSAAHLEQAAPEAGGRNVVNVILTDFRALDTLGEIIVLAVAAFGVLALVRARREPA